MGCGTAGALVPCSVRAGDLTRALLQHPLALFFFFLFVSQTAPDGRSNSFHLQTNEGREKREQVFLRCLGSWKRSMDAAR